MPSAYECPLPSNLCSRYAKGSDRPCVMSSDAPRGRWRPPAGMPGFCRRWLPRGRRSTGSGAVRRGQSGWWLPGWTVARSKSTTRCGPPDDFKRPASGPPSGACLKLTPQEPSSSPGVVHVGGRHRAFQQIVDGRRIGRPADQNPQPPPCHRCPDAPMSPMTRHKLSPMS